MNQNIKFISWNLSTQFKLCWRLMHFENAWRRNKIWLWRWVVWTEKLYIDQIQYIKSIFSNTGVSIKQMQADYNVSYSVLNKIKRSKLDVQEEWNHREITKIYETHKEVLIKSISEYVANTRKTLTTKEVTININRSFNTSYSVDFIRKIMKNESNITFKRVISRPNNIDWKKVYSIRNLFAIKFSKVVSKDALLINIDESSINRSVKIAYYGVWRANQ